MELPELILSSPERQAKVSKLLEGLWVRQDRLEQVQEAFRQELELGLQFGLERSSVQMETTYVTELLDGSETGRFLALDLGSTNFRFISGWSDDDVLSQGAPGGPAGWKDLQGAGPTLHCVS